MYSDEKKCFLCESEKFLNSQGVCEWTTSKIEGCHYYKNATECLKCKDNYQIQGNSCETNGPDNCAKWISVKDQKRCYECKKGFLIDVVNSLDTVEIVCKMIPVIDKCLKLSIDFKTCDLCERNYVWSSLDTVCQQVTTPIENCDFYSWTDKLICVGCKTNFFLDANGGCQE